MGSNHSDRMLKRCYHRSDSNQVSHFHTERALRDQGVFHDEDMKEPHIYDEPKGHNYGCKRRKLESLDMPHLSANELMHGTPNKSNKIFKSTFGVGSYQTPYNLSAQF